MNLKSLRNKPSRNGFDLSFKRNFTAKAGELLPVMVKEVLPGDVFNIDLSSFTRTQPVNTAAFARMREYYDFFFVPYNLLWNKADTLLTQMYDNPQHANSLLPTDSFTLKGEMPYITCEQIANYFSVQRSLGITSSSIKNNYFGYQRGPLSAKLLEYLGYGNFFDYVGSDTEKNTWSKNPLMSNLNLNVFGLLAYQKIYADFFRDSQWEKISPSTFNVDYMTGVDTLQMALPVGQTPDVNFFNSYNMFDLRYCNWQKDLFHGVVPSAQYGGGSTVYPIEGYFTGLVTSGTVAGNTHSSLDVLMLRQYEFLLKWREIAQSGNKDYKDQVQIGRASCRERV